MSYKKQLQKIITNEKPVGKKDFFTKVSQEHSMFMKFH